MKQLLMGSICLFLFASSVLLLQVSCSKTTAQNSNYSVAQIGKIIFVKNGQMWTANYDGTSQVQISVALPAGRQFAFNSQPQSGLAISPDGQKIFFTALDVSNGPPFVPELYSVNFDGSALTLLIGNGPAQGFSPIIAF